MPAKSDQYLFIQFIQYKLSLFTSQQDISEKYHNLNIVNYNCLMQSHAKDEEQTEQTNARIQTPDN